MKIKRLKISDIVIIEPEIFEDKRGFFYESYNEKIFAKQLGFSPIFVQENHSKSKKRVLRGLHYQLPDRAQSKLVRVVQGEIYDVAVDLRRDSLTFGHWIAVVLNTLNKKQLWIPEGFAHGFLVLSESAEILYKTTDYYSPDHERNIKWNDSKLAIEWKLDGYNPIISNRDNEGLSFEESEYF